jgi:SAM-dependent methyltransferase
MFNKLVRRLRREAFLTTWLSIIISPVHIIRSGLYKKIKEFSNEIEGRVLDFGCGIKPYESLFLNASEYIGLELEVSGHDHSDSKIDFFYNGKSLPFPDESFDSVVCFEVLEHVFNIDEILVEINRVLKPDGKFLLTVPFAWNEHEEPYDFARYTSFGLKFILTKNKFQIIKLRKTTTYFLAICQLFVAYLVQNVAPKGFLTRRVFQIFILFPLNLLSLAFDWILPKRYEYYCNLVVLARKTNCIE